MGWKEIAEEKARTVSLGLDGKPPSVFSNRLGFNVVRHSGSWACRIVRHFKNPTECTVLILGGKVCYPARQNH